MAIGQGDGSIILKTKVDTSGVNKGLSSIAMGAKKMASTAGKAFLAVGAAAATATVAIVKSSVEAYAEYEQLVGGVETLFKSSSKKVLEYANEAYKTTGQSANEYMKNVTAFSASLLSAVGGDTERAADVANAAMISISDNVNKMGSSAESVQLAFQGFAKQQYMLLDNLKLGYGGTKTEMERLLKDAQAITDVEYNIDNLADVYTAIGVIQEKLGIAGTTAKEASTTISGSAATMKAAWQNVLTAISGGGDLDRAIENLVESVSTFFENIVPVIERALSGVGSLIENVAPQLVQTVARSLIAAIPSLLNAVYEMIIGLAKGIYQGIIDLFSGTSKEVLAEQAESIEESVQNQEDLTNAVAETNEELEKTTASFDTVEILSAGLSEETSAEPIVPEISGGMEEGPEIEVEETEKELTAFEKKLKKIVKRIQKYFQPLQNISLENLKTSFDNLMISLTPYKDLVLAGLDWLWNDFLVPLSAWVVEDVLPQYLDLLSEKLALLSPTIDLIKGGLSWLYNDILVPLAAWTITQLLPTFLDLLTGAVRALGAVIAAAQPALAWLWDSFIKPFAEAVAETAINALEWLTGVLNDFADWAEENPEAMQNAVDIILSFLAGLVGYLVTNQLLIHWGTFVKLWGDFRALMQLIATEGFFKTITTLFGGSLSNIQLWAIAIGVIVGAIAYLAMNWDKLSPAQRTITILSALAAAATAAAVAVALFHTSWSVGLAAATIAAGVALLAGTYLFKSYNGKKDLSGGGAAPASIDQNAYLAQGGTYKLPALAKGAVLPANKPFLAVVGDQKHGTNIEAPLQTIVDAFNIALAQNGNVGGGNTEVVLEIDGREFGRAVVEQGNRENRRIGTRLVIA